MYINFTSRYEHMLCAAKQPLGVAYAAEGLKCRRQCRAMWKGWMKRQQYRSWKIRNVKLGRRWAEQQSDSERDLEACILIEGGKKRLLT
jgi:hypothetical protein